MKKLIEFRIWENTYQYISKPNPAIFNGAIWILRISDQDPLISEIKDLNDKFRKTGDNFYLTARYIRTYSKSELDGAQLLLFYSKTQFGPSGEECGTLYDRSVACQICSANAKQCGELRLRKSSIPKKDISTSIGDETIFSQKFVDAFKKWKLKGVTFVQVLSHNKPIDFYQIVPSRELLNVNSQTVVKADVFNDFPKYEDYTFIDNSNKQVTGRYYYHCPKGHLLGGNLISEVFVSGDKKEFDADLYLTRQLLGVRMGAFRPYPIYLCSQRFRRMVTDEKLSGFGFQTAHIV